MLSCLTSILLICLQRASLSDFDRFKLMKAKQAVSNLINNSVALRLKEYLLGTTNANWKELQIQTIYLHPVTGEKYICFQRNRLITIEMGKLRKAAKKATPKPVRRNKKPSKRP